MSPGAEALKISLPLTGVLSPITETLWGSNSEAPEPGNLLVHILGCLPGWDPKLALCTQTARRDQKWGKSVAIVRRELAYAGGHRGPQDKVDLCTHPLESSEFREFLTGYPSGLATTLLSQSYVLEMAGSMGIVGGRYILRTGEGSPLLAGDPNHRSTGGPIFLITSSNRAPCWFH